MYITGIGIVSALGRGVDNCEKALRSADKPETYRVNADVLSGKTLPKRMRRADRFSKMATLAAMDAVRDSHVDIKKTPGSLGIVLSTALGPHATSFKFIDDLISYGEENVSPITFAHSVHNAAVSYINAVLENRGPALTVTGFVFSFHQALLVARSWLNEKRCKNVLVGSVDERGEVADSVFCDMMGKKKGLDIKPFDFSGTSSIDPGEGGVFFMLSRDDSQKRYCKVAGVSHGGFADDNNDKKADVYILDTGGLTRNETAYMAIKEKEAWVAGYSPLFGSTPGLSAFHCAVGALSIKNRRSYACPVQDNPHGVNLCVKGEEMDIKSIVCVKYNCRKERAEIRLER